MALLAVGLLPTASYFPRHYGDLVNYLDAGTVRLVLLRNLALIGLVATLTLRFRSLPGQPKLRSDRYAALI